MVARLLRRPTVVVPASPCILSIPSSVAMAERNDPEETRRRIAAERVRLQEIGRRNSEAAKERMRLKPEVVAAAERAESEAKKAVAAAGIVFPNLEDMVIKAPSRPPLVPPKSKGGTS